MALLCLQPNWDGGTRKGKGTGWVMAFQGPKGISDLSGKAVRGVS